jgi:hypothetical protein
MQICTQLNGKLKLKVEYKDFKKYQKENYPVHYE